MIKKALFIAALAGSVACGGGYEIVTVPPAVDLASFGQLGLVTFAVENAKGDLDEMATQAFVQEITRAQRTPVLELGGLDALLARVDKKTLDPEAVKAVGKLDGIGALFVGTITVSKVKPSVDIAGALSQLRVRAGFDMSASVRLVSAETGATLWTNSRALNAAVGFLGLGGDGIPDFSMRDQGEAVQQALRELFFAMTHDFRPTTVRR